MGKGALSTLWPYPKVSQNILSLSNGELGREEELAISPTTGNYTVESLIIPCGEKVPPSVMAVSSDSHSIQGRSHVSDSPGNTKNK